MGGLLADAGDVGERGAEGAAAALVLVEGDGKAVHLVLYLLEQVEQLVGGLQLHHGCLAVGVEAQQLVGAVVLVLGEAGDGQVDAEAVYHLLGHVHLAFAAVDQQQVGQRLLLVEQPPVAPLHHLGHRGVVVVKVEGGR